ncbi:MAG: hypothetical protein K9I34_04275 [Bacteroidales bacterium]|nr:hypothetical protein [Bacteroidales bacterium]
MSKIKNECTAINLRNAKRFGTNQHIIAVRDRYLTRRSYASLNFAERERAGQSIESYDGETEYFDEVINYIYN